MKKCEIDFDIVSQLLHYDRESGKLFWEQRTAAWFRNPGANDCRARSWNTKFAGRETGCPDKDGYLEVRLLGHLFKAHRLVWLLETGTWPSNHIDHQDGDKSNNRFENLRDVTILENNRNISLRANNSSGVSGVNWCADRKTWCAYIYHGSKTVSLGRFKDKDCAIAARKAAEAERGYHPNHGRASRIRGGSIL